MLTKKSLNGTWGFLIDPSQRGLLPWCQYPHEYPSGELYPSGAGDLHKGFADLALEKVPVPGSWQLYAEQYRWYDGTAFYFKKFGAGKPKAGQRSFLRFDGISFRARAWLNGVEIGQMDFPYLPWEMEVTGQLKASNLLVVRIEASPSPGDTIPVFGWRNYAGILRPVSLITTGPARLGSVLLDPVLDLDSGEGTMKARFEVDPGKARGLQVEWTLRGHGLKCGGKVRVGAAKDGWQGFEIPKNKVKFWSPDAPVLYDFELSLRDAKGAVLDRYGCRTGFRKFEARGAEGFFLNGKPVWPRGISRLNLHETFGMTLNEEWLKTDMDLVQELNCNALRVSHLTNDEEVLDECDRRGLLAWAEVPVYWNADLKKASVREKMLGQIEAMLRRDYNHPAVVMWSVANEIKSELPEGLRALKQARNLVRRFDPRRPVTFASWPRDPEKNLGLRCIDFCSMNLYRGWYQHDTGMLRGDLKSIRKYAPHLPVVLSEFGAGAVAGRRGSEDTPWTEEFQRRVIRDNLATIRELGHGCFLWLLNDYLDPSRVHSKITSGFINNKGIVTGNRKHKKLAFAFVRDTYARWKAEDALPGKRPRQAGSPVPAASKP